MPPGSAGMQGIKSRDPRDAGTSLATSSPEFRCPPGMGGRTTVASQDAYVDAVVISPR